MGTATLSNPTKVSVGGELKVVKATLTMSSSYIASGDTLAILTTAGVGLNQIDSVLISPTKLARLWYDAAAGKVWAYQGSSEVGNGTDLSASTVPVLIFGR